MGTESNTEQYAGYWWLPENPERTVAGFLSFVPGGKISVECIELLEPILLKPGQNPIELKRKIYDTVLGKVKIDGTAKNVTLLEASSTYFTVPTGNFFFNQPEELDVGWLLIGEHFPNKENVRINEFEVHFAHLTQWTGYVPFRAKHEADENGKLVSLSYSYEFPEVEKYEMANFNGTLSFSSLVSTKQAWKSEVHLSHTTSTTFRTKEDVSLETFIEPAYDFQVLFSILTNQMPWSIKYKAKRMRKDAWGKATRVLASFDLYFHSKHQWVASENEKSKLLSSFANFEADFPKILNQWFSNVHRYREAAELYYDNLATAQRYNSLRFLTTAQAVETAHRRLYGDSTFTSDEERVYNALRRTFNTALDEESQISQNHKSDLKEKLRHLPDTTLKNRLNELWVKAENVIQDVVPDESGFNKKVRDTRNYYTHYTESLKDRAAKDWELAKLTVQLEALLLATFLLELGISEETISALFAKHFKWLKQLA